MYESICLQTIGGKGRMISMSKSQYRYQHPRNLTIFNARISLETLEIIWWGDLDITLDIKRLKQLSYLINKPIYIFNEHDSWNKIDNLNHYIIQINPDETYILNPRYSEYINIQ